MDFSSIDWSAIGLALGGIAYGIWSAISAKRTAKKVVAKAEQTAIEVAANTDEKLNHFQQHLVADQLKYEATIRELTERIVELEREDARKTELIRSRDKTISRLEAQIAQLQARLPEEYE